MTTTYKEISNITQDNLIRIRVYLSIETRCCDYLSCQSTGDFAPTIIYGDIILRRLVTVHKL